MKVMTRNLKVTIVLAAVATVAVAVLLVATRPDTAPPAEAHGKNTNAELLVRPDSHRLSSASDDKVTLVEFLDFECEACGAAYPAVEQLREEYAGQITYVVRYFPIPSHPNAELAAWTAQAAAEQGKFEAMYQMLFENQAEWGHRKQPQRDMFLGYARQIGLDLEQFREDWDSAATKDRVRRDQADGQALGVQGTPTFFLNGEMIAPQSLDDLRTAVESALARP
ncbi:MULTISPECIES: DsbA family protein [Saccharomonospora]|uniref:Protein-disulfide isomerase n=2 Tax=Saccharomonospora TaxID=1851 RepID=H5XFA2_9PSEU|nr:thioredoxin domain-containing protein [Saccharomonospora azurea]EHR61512.1 protein-disulfide isomerase [Saccharomonospora cyanea NA-134]EHY87429.1 protein-disulfide isomerase [Saccharomonospora azurea NA-128]